MKYGEFAEVYEKLVSKSGRIEKVGILAQFLKKLGSHGESRWIYLIHGRVFPDYDPREFGISTKIVIKAIATSYGIGEKEVNNKYKKVGDLGEITSEFAEKKRQSVLFKKPLDAGKVFDNLIKITSMSGKGSTEKKIGLISELLSGASDIEAKYIIRTILGDLRVGVAEGIIREAIVEAFFETLEGDRKKEINDLVEEAYNISGDSAVVLESAMKGEKALRKINIVPGKPMKVMLAVKAESISDAFEMCGKPAAFEYKYDGFRMLINKKGNEISLFTRKLENVTNQFPDVVKVVKEHIKGSEYIVDCEVVGYDPKTKKYQPFEAISQRIKRKYDIDKLIKDLPVEINVFDLIYHNGENYIDLPLLERRKKLESIIIPRHFLIRLSEQLVTDSEEKAQEFYEKSLKAGEEGVMIKRIDAPYKAGRRVGNMAKLKPDKKDLDLVIVKAEHGTGKRGGWLTSYTVACRNGDGEFVELGKVSSGLKEREEEGMTYEEMTKLIKPLILKETKDEVIVKPKIVVSVAYQNIQESPSYNSGYALRFPRITRYRPDRGIKDITTLDEIKMDVQKARKYMLV